MAFELPDHLRKEGFVTVNAAAETLGIAVDELQRYITDHHIGTYTFSPGDGVYPIVKIKDVEGARGLAGDRDRRQQPQTADKPETDKENHVTVDDYADATGVPADDIETLVRYSLIGGEPSLSGRIEGEEILVADDEKNDRVIEDYRQGNIDIKKILQELKGAEAEQNKPPDPNADMGTYLDAVLEKGKQKQTPIEIAVA